MVAEVHFFKSLKDLRKAIPNPAEVLSYKGAENSQTEEDQPAKRVSKPSEKLLSVIDEETPHKRARTLSSSILTQRKTK